MLQADTDKNGWNSAIDGKLSCLLLDPSPGGSISVFGISVIYAGVKATPLPTRGLTQHL